MTHEAIARATDAMLRSFGATEVALVLPTAAGSDLGLSGPVVEQVALAPAVVRAAAGSRPGIELLLPAATVAAAAELRNLNSAEALFETALGVLHGGRLLRITSVASDTFAGTPYLFRITAAE